MIAAAESWTPKDVASIGISTMALLFSIMSYRHTRKVAKLPGRVHGAWIRRGRANQQSVIELVVSSGPSAMGIVFLFLEVEYRVAGNNVFDGHDYAFRIEPDEFEFFGVAGPELPHRVKQYAQAVWYIPDRRGYLTKGDRVRYRLHGETTLGEPFASKWYTQPSDGLYARRIVLQHSRWHSSAAGISTNSGFDSNVRRWLMMQK